MRAMEVDAFIVVVLAVGLSFVIAIAAFLRGGRKPAASNSRQCAKCKAENLAAASYCRRCGTLME
jgi:hypothetical protein